MGTLNRNIYSQMLQKSQYALFAMAMSGKAVNLTNQKNQVLSNLAQDGAMTSTPGTDFDRTLLAQIRASLSRSRSLSSRRRSRSRGLAQVKAEEGQAQLANLAQVEVRQLYGCSRSRSRSRDRRRGGRRRNSSCHSR